MARLYKKGMRNIGIKVCLKVNKTFNKQDLLVLKMSKVDLED